MLLSGIVFIFFAITFWLIPNNKSEEPQRQPDRLSFANAL